MISYAVSESELVALTNASRKVQPKARSTLRLSEAQKSSQVSFYFVAVNNAEKNIRK